MRTPTIPLFVAIASALACATGFSAPVVTNPSGYVTITLLAGNAVTPVNQFIGLGVSRPQVYQSLVPTGAGLGKSVVGGSSRITFPANTFTAGQFGNSSTATTHFVEILNGANAGEISHIIATATNSITLYDNLDSILVNGTTSIRIRPFWTVAGAFGTNNSAGFLGAATSGAADVITISGLPDPVVPSVQIFYNTTAAAWQTVGGQAAGTQTIPIDAGIVVARRGTNTPSFKLVGEVKTGKTGLMVEGGSSEMATTLQNPYPLGSVMLKDSGLYTGSATTGVVGGTSATAADVVTIQDPTTGDTNDFFFDTTSARWKVGFTDASLYKIPENASIKITRRATRSAFTWSSPQPVMALGTDPLPLTLVAAMSRKTHGAAGTWDVNLPIGGGTGIESRAPGSGNTHSVVFDFSGASASNPITAATVNLTSGVGSIVGSPVLSNGTVTVNLTGVTDLQTIQLQISGVTAQNAQVLAGSTTVPVGLLQGDVSYNSAVSAGDTVQVKLASSPGTVNLTNFRCDGNVNGAINAGDTVVVKLKSGNSL